MPKKRKRYPTNPSAKLLNNNTSLVSWNDAYIYSFLLKLKTSSTLDELAHHYSISPGTIEDFCLHFNTSYEKLKTMDKNQHLKIFKAYQFERVTVRIPFVNRCLVEVWNVAKTKKSITETVNILNTNLQTFNAFLGIFRINFDTLCMSRCVNDLTSLDCTQTYQEFIEQKSDTSSVAPNNKVTDTSKAIHRDTSNSNVLISSNASNINQLQPANLFNAAHTTSTQALSAIETEQTSSRTQSLVSSQYTVTPADLLFARDTLGLTSDQLACLEPSTSSTNRSTTSTSSINRSTISLFELWHIIKANKIYEQSIQEKPDLSVIDFNKSYEQTIKILNITASQFNYLLDQYGCDFRTLCCIEEAVGLRARRNKFSSDIYKQVEIPAEANVTLLQNHANPHQISSVTIDNLGNQEEVLIPEELPVPSLEELGIIGVWRVIRTTKEIELTLEALKVTEKELNDFLSSYNSDFKTLSNMQTPKKLRQKAFNKLITSANDSETVTSSTATINSLLQSNSPCTDQGQITFSIENNTTINTEDSSIAEYLERELQPSLIQSLQDIQTTPDALPQIEHEERTEEDTLESEIISLPPELLSLLKSSP